MNKALDLNKLFIAQAKGTLLKKHLKFPMFGSIKSDGNYVTIIKRSRGELTFITSGNHEYTHDEPTIFHNPKVSIGVYKAERIGTDGKLGDRSRCNLRGTRGAQISVGHSYVVHDFMSIEDHIDGKATHDYWNRDDQLRDSGIPYANIPNLVELFNQDEVDAYLDKIVKQGYEGIMLKSLDWIWTRTKSRKIDLVKYKKRPTVDLLVIGATEGTGKYEGMIGSLLLRDKAGREVSVGSGMSDNDRCIDPVWYIGKVVEMFYEQIMDTYIQPTFGDEYEGVLVREDKDANDID